MRQTLIEIYAARVAAGTLHADAAQRAVLPAMEAIRIALEAPVKKPGLFGLFAKPPETVRGTAWRITSAGKRWRLNDSGFMENASTTGA